MTVLCFAVVVYAALVRAAVIDRLWALLPW